MISGRAVRPAGTERGFLTLMVMLMLAIFVILMLGTAQRLNYVRDELRLIEKRQMNRGPDPTLRTNAVVTREAHPTPP